MATNGVTVKGQCWICPVDFFDFATYRAHLDEHDEEERDRWLRYDMVDIVPATINTGRVLGRRAR